MDRAARLLLIVLTVATPLARALDGLSGSPHCRAHGSSLMPGMDHSDVASQAQPGTDGTAISDHHCSHCPPTDCTTTTPCSGSALSVAIGTRAAAWSSCAAFVLTVSNTTRWLGSAGFPPPTPPPQA